MEKIDNKIREILKRRHVSELLIFMVTAEDLYDKLIEAHIQTGHGRRDKMLYYIRKESITRSEEISSELRKFVCS